MATSSAALLAPHTTIAAKSVTASVARARQTNAMRDGQRAPPRDQATAVAGDQRAGRQHHQQRAEAAAKQRQPERADAQRQVRLDGRDARGEHAARDAVQEKDERGREARRCHGRTQIQETRDGQLAGRRCRQVSGRLNGRNRPGFMKLVIALIPRLSASRTDRMNARRARARRAGAVDAEGDAAVGPRRHQAERPAAVWAGHPAEEIGGRAPAHVPLGQWRHAQDDVLGQQRRKRLDVAAAPRRRRSARPGRARRLARGERRRAWRTHPVAPGRAAARCWRPARIRRADAATSRADQPSTSRSSSTARWRGPRRCSAATKASSMDSLVS